jgi:hypothetical protein
MHNATLQLSDIDRNFGPVYSAVLGNLQTKIVDPGQGKELKKIALLDLSHVVPFAFPLC